MSERIYGSTTRRGAVDTSTTETSPGKRTLAQAFPNVVQAKSASTEAPSVDPAQMSSSQASRLDPVVEAGMGAHFGTDFSSVQVHTDGTADAMCESAGARALTTGSDVYFRAGAYQPESHAGRELIGHELAHVVQQQQGQTVGLAAKADDGSQRNSLEGDADAKGSAAAASMAGPVDWNQVDMTAYQAELHRRSEAGEPVPVGKNAAAAKESPLSKEIARKFMKGGKAGGGAKPAGGGGPVQAKKDWNEWPWSSGVYNSVEVNVAGKRFIDLPFDTAPANYSFAPNVNATAHGANSVRDDNFGMDMIGTGTIHYNWDSFKKANWSAVSRAKVGGAGTKTISMHNWAFSNIEAAENFEVVDSVISVGAGSFKNNLFGMDQKIPVILAGAGAAMTVTASQVVKQSSGWTVGQEIADSTTLTRSMSAGLSSKLEKKDVYKVGAEGGLSSTNVDTVWSKVATASGASASASAGSGAALSLTSSGKAGIKKYVYPVFNVKNFKVNAYPHKEATAEVTGGPKTFSLSYVTLDHLESIDMDADGKVAPPASPSPAQDADDDRLKKDKEGREVDKKGGVRLSVGLASERDAQKDFDKQDFTQTPLTPGEKRKVSKTWATEITNSFSINDSGGKKVSGTGGWSLGASGEYMGLGGKLGYSEMESSAGEFGDSVVQNKSNGQAVQVSIDQEANGPEKGSAKVTQVIISPLFKERTYQYSAFDDTKNAWVPLPVKARSRAYYPMPALTLNEVPRGSELKPEGADHLDDKDTEKGAKAAKDIKSKIDAEKDPTKKAALEKELEEELKKNREALEESVRRVHPSLSVVDRAKNIYEIEMLVPNSNADKAAASAKGEGTSGYTSKKYRSTLEGLLDFTPPSVAAHNAADALASKDADPSDGVTITATAGLGGTGAQGRANPYPGDVDLSESIKIVAPTADAAASAMAASVQQTVRVATKPQPDGKLGYQFLGMMVGTYPKGAAKEGKALSWTPAQVMAGSLDFKDKHGKSASITLAQAIADPAAGRACNTYWRGPIDATGTYGEITKVLTYEAVTASGDKLFATPQIGQSYQGVGFGGEGVHDTERAKLLEALGPQIQKYAHEGDWVKALKRAYTVARMLNDLGALNMFTPLMGGDVSQLKQVADHVEIFAMDVVNPKQDEKLKDAIGGGMTKEQANTEADLLVSRLSGIDKAKTEAEAMQSAIRLAHGDMRSNAAAYSQIEHHVVAPLKKQVKGDTKFAKDAETALVVSGYLKGK